MGSELELDIVIMDHFIENVNKKREGAWRELYRRFYPALCNYALKIVKDTDVAEDVVPGGIYPFIKSGTGSRVRSRTLREMGRESAGGAGRV